jgi:predicted DNA-binding protein YlxM (UPF0122 family)
VNITIPISVGELLDKITILQIKSQYTTNNYISKELELLTTIAKENNIFKSEWLESLYKVNQILWNIEDEIRIKEKNHEFDTEFILLARSVYLNNDKRAEIKRKINDEVGSELKEIKVFMST